MSAPAPDVPATGGPARDRPAPGAFAPVRLVPAVLAGLGLVAVVYALADVRATPLHDVRVVVTTLFLVLGPGWALAGFLRTPSFAGRAVVAVGAGLSVTILAGQIMVVSGAWHPVGLLLATAVVVVPVLARHAIRSR